MADQKSGQEKPILSVNKDLARCLWIIKKIVIGESNYYSIGRNYNRIAILSEMLKGREVVIMDDVGEEYKSLQDEIIKPIN